MDKNVMREFHKAARFLLKDAGFERINMDAPFGPDRVVFQEWGYGSVETNNGGTDDSGPKHWVIYDMERGAVTKVFEIVGVPVTSETLYEHQLLPPEKARMEILKRIVEKAKAMAKPSLTA